MGYKFGLEKEYFLRRENTDHIFEVPDKYPQDGCGYLVEARGKPCSNIIEAVFSLKAEEYRIKRLVGIDGFCLSDTPVDIVPKDLRLKIARTHTKGLISYQNLYGYESHRNAQNEGTAGIHLSITHPFTYRIDGKDVEYNGIFDFVQIFRKLDEAFKTEFKESKRNPGFYEIKFNGRVEYRSLPASASLDKIINVVEEIMKGK
jgi:hypothetical protein